MTKHIEKSKVKVLTDNEAQKLFQKFAAPLFRGANSVTRKKSAHELAKTLWVALVTGHENEEMIFEELRKSLADPESIQVIRDCYYDKMKPLITEEELQALIVRYQVKKK